MIPLADLASVHAPLREELRDAVMRVVDSGRFVLGSEVRAFESEFAEAFGFSGSLVGTSSGTDALVIALRALDVGPGDEVVTTPLSFVATTEAIVRVGATPVFVDVDEETLGIEPSRVEEALGPRTKAILLVHLFGYPARVRELAALACRRGVALVEDVAQSLGAEVDGRPLGSFGDAAAFSFFPAKVLGGLGDAGMVRVPTALGDRARALRIHGTRDRETFDEVGGNYRLDEVQAAVLRVKLRYLAGWLEERRRLAGLYERELRGLVGVRLPRELAGTRAVVGNYVPRFEEVEEVAARLEAASIASARYYRRLLPEQPCFAALSRVVGELTVARRASARLLALPLHPHLRDDELARVVVAVRGER